MNPPYRARDRPLPVDTPWHKFTYIMKGNASNEKVYQSDCPDPLPDAASLLPHRRFRR